MANIENVFQAPLEFDRQAARRVIATFPCRVVVEINRMLLKFNKTFDVVRQRLQVFDRAI